MSNSASFPATLSVQAIPTSPSGPFVELQNPLYQPVTHPFGVCISGGGTRSFSAAIGQMRGLLELGLLDLIGAVSCVSGGSWFGTLFSYAPESVDDATLLGPVVAPQDLTLENISSTPAGFIGSPIPQMTNFNITASVLFYEVSVPQNRVYSRMLNALLLSSFSLDNLNTFFTLDATAVSAILENNKSLTASNFYTMRSGRPYFIAGATQVYPTGTENDILRHFEYTPLYVGIPQFFAGAGPNGTDFGGGYVQSFGFDSTTPANESNPTSVPTPSPQFLLSDVMGSSGAAPGAILDSIGLNNFFTEFNYWPPVKIGQESSALYSFVDGGNLENVGIVPLLRRQYPIIIAFFNSSNAIGSTDPSCVQGISGDISRMFGFIPQETLGNTQNTQIFPSERFTDLVNGLKATQNTGAFYVDSYSILENNAFGVAPYPNDGKVIVVWLYNNLNQNWKNQITNPDVLNLLNGSDPTNNFSNFPNYATVGQNLTQVEGVDVPELLLLTAEQVNLLADMWCYTVMSDAVSSSLNALKEQFVR